MYLKVSLGKEHAVDSMSSIAFDKVKQDGGSVRIMSREVADPQYNVRHPAGMYGDQQTYSMQCLFSILH